MPKGIKPQIIKPHAYTDSHTQPTKHSILLKTQYYTIYMIKQ